MWVALLLSWIILQAWILYNIGYRGSIYRLNWSIPYAVTWTTDLKICSISLAKLYIFFKSSKRHHCCYLETGQILYGPEKFLLCRLEAGLYSCSYCILCYILHYTLQQSSAESKGSSQLKGYHPRYPESDSHFGTLNLVGQFFIEIRIFVLCKLFTYFTSSKFIYNIWVLRSLVPISIFKSHQLFSTL